MFYTDPPQFFKIRWKQKSEIILVYDSLIICQTTKRNFFSMTVPLYAGSCERKYKIWKTYKNIIIEPLWWEVKKEILQQ